MESLSRSVRPGTLTNIYGAVVVNKLFCIYGSSLPGSGSGSHP